MGIDSKTLRSMIENMEQAAESALREDTSFFEALQALKADIDSDPRVQSAIRELQANGNQVFNSFVPQIRIKVRTGKSLWSLPKRAVARTDGACEKVKKLTEELKEAASSVILNSRYRSELNAIVSEAVHADSRFEHIACSVENAGCELLICLDLSAYTQVRKQGRPQASSAEAKERRPSRSADHLVELRLSDDDFQFLRAIKISSD